MGKKSLWSIYVRAIQPRLDMSKAIVLNFQLLVSQATNLGFFSLPLDLEPHFITSCSCQDLNPGDFSAGFPVSLHEQVAVHRAPEGLRPEHRRHLEVQPLGALELD